MNCTSNSQRFCKASQNFSLHLFSNRSLDQMICRVLDESDRWHKRLRALSADLMMHFSLLMVLRRELSIPGVFEYLVRLVRDNSSDPRLPLKSVTDEAVHKARARLGSEPLHLLFQKTADRVDPMPSLNGLSVYAADGATFSVPDTAANEEYFRRPGASKGRSAFPMLKVLALVSTEEHLVKDAVMGERFMDERQAFLKLARKHLGSRDLVMLDRGFAAGYLIEELLELGTNFLLRIPLRWKFTRKKKLGKGDWIIEINKQRWIRKEIRKQGGQQSKRIRLTLRMIEFRTRKTKVVRLLTNLPSTKEFPALELAQAYHKRWEIETSFDELKTHLLSVKHGTLHTVFRSKSPDGVLQEAWATLAAYNLIRELMVDAAYKVNLNPWELSFVGALRAIQDALPRFAAANSTLSVILSETLIQDLIACRLMRPRRKRLNPRRVRKKMSNRMVKRKEDKGIYYDYEKEIRLINFRSRTTTHA